MMAFKIDPVSSLFRHIKYLFVDGYIKFNTGIIYCCNYLAIHF